MKRFFENSRHRLSEDEQERIWERLAAAQRGRRERARRWTGWRPAFAASAVALAALGAIVLFGDRREALLGVDRLRDMATEAPAVEVDAVPAARKGESAPAPVLGAADVEVAEVDEAAGSGEVAAVAGTVEQGDRIREQDAGGEPAREQAAAPAPPEPDSAVLPPDAERPRAAAAAPATPTESESFQKYAIDSVEEALARQSGKLQRGGELYVRGGRSGETRLRLDEGAPEGKARRQAAAPTAPDPAAPAGTAAEEAPPDAMFFRNYGVSPFVITEEDALSTFALDVDGASYAVARRYLRDGRLPPPAAVRLEEFVNSFEAGYAAPERDALALSADGAPSPFGEGYHLLRIGVSARAVTAAARRPANLVFVIDVSGSMRRESRLELVKQSLALLLDELDEGDRVGIVVYGTQGRVLLEPTGVERRERIEAAIAALQPEGSTNVEEGLELGYRMARGAYDAQAVNRLVLCSDGVANQGRTDADGILERVRRRADEGIHLSTVGFGMGNYNDVLLEKLADRGDGNYHYVDGLDEARRVFRENLTGTLQVVAEEARVQVEFDALHVRRYRLLGYENRDVADADFRDDGLDAGEVGAGHRVTALYEVELSADAARRLGGDEADADVWGEEPARGGRERPAVLATVRLRYREPAGAGGGGDVREIAREVTTRDVVRSFAAAPPRLQLAALVAEFAEILRGSYWARDGSLAALVPLADGLAERLPDDPAVQELRDLVRRAAEIDAGD